MSATKNFSLQEFACPCGCPENHTKLELLYKLQCVRDYLDKDDKMIITSGYRCFEYNRSLGSTDTSSHPKGLAADIDVQDNGKAFRIQQAVFQTGAFTRIGFGKMNGKNTLHLDVDDSKMQERLWGY